MGSPWQLGDFRVDDQGRPYERARANPIGHRSGYAIQWGANVTQPAIGNGILEGMVSRVGQLVFVSIRLEMKSTTTYGSGVWWFTLPYTIADPVVSLNGYAVNNGVGYYSTFTIPASSYQCYILAMLNGTLNFCQNTSPHTWKNGDVLYLNGTYLTADP